MRHRVVVVAVTALVVAAGLVSLVLNLMAPPRADMVRPAQVIYCLDPVWIGVIGGYLVARRPRNLTAWALWVLSIATAVDGLSSALMDLAQAGRAVPAALAGWAAWVEDWVWVFVFLALLELLLRFPDGMLPGRAWRWVERATLAVAAVAVAVGMAAAVNDDAASVALPIGFLPSSFVDVVTTLAFFAFVAVAGAAFVGLVVRFRRARGVRRAQLQWLLAAGGLFFGAFAVVIAAQLVWGERVSIPAPVAAVGDMLTELAPLTVPVAVAVAVTRYGLFEIDRVVSRTAAYAAVIAVLAALYAGVVAAGSELVPASAGAVPVAAATLAASALFLPLRRRVVRAVDRRFHRGRYDAERVITGFAERMRPGPAPDLISDDLVAATTRALQPAHAQVWLVERS